MSPKGFKDMNTNSGKRLLKRLSDFHSGKDAKEKMEMARLYQTLGQSENTEKYRALARKSQKNLKRTRAGEAAGAGSVAAGGVGYASHKQNKKIKAHDDLRFQ